MDPTRVNRKVLPNYLLDDYVPSSDSKAASNQGASSSSLPSVESSHRHLDGGVDGIDATQIGGDLSDASGTQLGHLPRRKKKLRQACVYCRRSHLVCEEKRPCHRCVKRGIADRCVDPPQDAQSLSDGVWPIAAETGSITAGSANDARVSRTPPTNQENANRKDEGSSSTSTDTEFPGQEGVAKRKRKAKSVTPRTSAPSQRANQDVGSRPDYGRTGSGMDVGNPTVSHTSSTFDQAGAHSIPNSVVDQSHTSSLSSAMPPHSAAQYASVPLTMPIQPETSATGARGGPSQMLTAQPIFQPPSSAELDSLFSTYFFDVADAFSTRPHAAQHASLSSQQPMEQTGSVFHPAQPQHHPPAPHHSGHPGSGEGFHPAHGQRMDPSAGATFAHQQPHEITPQQQHGLSSSMNMHQLASGVPISGQNPPLVNAEWSQNSKDPAARQKPGDVYAPYPYRKGYASLMRYMTEQKWSQQSIRSVEAALSKVRRLWFSLEDNIQPSNMIQLQAEWAGNVRYFSESVLPFTPIPMMVCRKAGEVYASNQLAQKLCGRSKEQMTGGKLSCYELMTESSASMFFRLYELAVGGSQAEDGSYIPAVGNTEPLYWNAEIVRQNADGSQSVVPTRGIFEMKIAPCGLPSLLVCCFVPLT